MLFFEPRFFAFFAVFIALYLLLQGRLRVQNLLILVASYIFYGAWDVRFLILIAISTSIDFLVGLMLAGHRPDRRMVLAAALPPLAVLAALVPLSPASAGPIAGMTLAGAAVFAGAAWLAQRREGDARRRALLAISVTANLGILGVFKYFDFFASQLAALLAGFGITADPMLLNLVLPVGISFYTFQTMSYTIDIYRRKLEPTRDLINFAAFVAFFPQLVAGPIERASRLLPQFFEPRRLSWAAAASGAGLFAWGMFKKVVIADSMGPISDAVFAAPTDQPAGALLAGVLAFTFQIYCDFSGYSDMALGLARIMGFRLMVNFNKPYIARTPSEFWQRWHISLSTWLRDYLYIPLGGNRGGRWMTYRNLMTTMLLGGLWHGAAWTFIAWGAFHGGILALYRMANVDAWVERVSARGGELLTYLVLGPLMFLLAVISWVFFRAQSFGDAFHMLAHMWRPVWSEAYGTVALFAVPLMAVEIFCRSTGRDQIWQRMPWFVQFNIFLFLGYAILVLSANTGQEFIYFDF